MPLPRNRLWRLAAVGLALTLAVWMPGASSASLRSRLSHARSELVSLARKIRTEESQKTQLENELAAVQVKIDSAAAKANLLAGTLKSLQDQIARAQSHLAALQAQLDQIARAAYMGNSGSAAGTYLETIFNATSLPDLSDRLEFMSRVSQNDSDIANQVAALKYQLSTQAERVQSLLHQQSVLLAQLTNDRQQYAQAFAQEKKILANLDRTRTQIVALVKKLKKRLEAAELAGLGSAFQGTNNAPYGIWADGFLKYMGLSSCHNNEIVMVSWQVAEFTQAAWNPLATTWPMPGSTTFNYAGVQNYTSASQGMEATRLTLQNGSSSYGYGAIVTSLSQCADPMTTADAIQASSWCSGCAGGAYVTSVVPKVEADYSVYAKL
jgi:peptidoglycan hydrolase CwlO-like protein